MRVRLTITGAPSGRQPPLRPVPVPRGTNGTPSALRSFRTAATSSVERGSTTTSGIDFSSVYPSQS